MRAWDIKAKEWINPQKFAFNSLGEFAVRQYATNWYIPSQWTGELDNTGVEIYEGDILLGKSYKDVIMRRKGKEVAGIVVFKSNGWGRGSEFIIDHEFPYPYRTCLVLSECDVIGNIFENPELIKQYDLEEIIKRNLLSFSK